MPYALYCAEMVYKAWNAGKQIFNSNAARKFSAEQSTLLTIQIKEQCASTICCHKTEANSCQILTELTLQR